MKCKDCYCCRRGFFHSRPDDYVCTGVREPFVISDINMECTEHTEKRTKDCVPKYCYGLVNKDGKLIKYKQSPRLFVVKAYAKDAAEKYNRWYKNKVEVVTFRLERES